MVKTLFAAALAVAAALAATPSRGADATSQDDALLDLSVEQLLETEVTTASRRAQTAGSVPAQLYVLTQADIRRSGASSLPELLRVVPGLQIAQIDANKWTAGARGFSRRFSNKLLVLIDGRPVYSPLFSGVHWDAQDTDLDSVERIEVVSGPGATLWGPNAVNGVINIITRAAQDTPTRSLRASVDPDGAASLQGFVAGELTESMSARFFAKQQELSGNENALGVVADDSQYSRVGVRIDAALGLGALAVTSEAYDGRSGSMTVLVNPQTLQAPPRIIDDEFSGAFVNARWNRPDRAGGELAVGASFEATDRDGAFYLEERKTAQLDFQHALAPGERHSLLYGASYRRSDDCILGKESVSLRNVTEAVIVAGAFLQDEVTLVPDRWDAVFGAKVEHESLSDSVHFEPNIRLRYRVSDRTMLWASVARAVGMPSRGERDVEFTGPLLVPFTAFNPTPYPMLVQTRSTGRVRAERGDTLEVGGRWHSTRHDLRVESALYVARFDRLARTAPGQPLCAPSGAALGPFGCPPGTAYVIAPNSIVSTGEADAHGLELSTEWRPWQHVRLLANYSLQIVSDRGATPPGAIFAAAPKQQLHTRVSVDLPRGITLDTSARYIDENKPLAVPAYVAVDARVAWAPHASIEMALVGKNLFDPEHVEAVSEIGDLVPVPIERTASFELRYRF
jgi:iron complex outermembrane receptor protein